MLAALSAIHRSTRSSPLSDILHRSQVSGTLVLVLLAPRLPPIYTDYAIVTSLFSSSSCYHLIVNSRTPHPPPFYPMFYHTKGAYARSPYHRRSLCVSLLPYLYQLWKISQPNTVPSQYADIFIRAIHTPTITRYSIHTL